MTTRLLDHRDVQAVVSGCGLDGFMDGLIEGIAGACATFDPDATAIPVRSGFDYSRPTEGLLEWMPLLQHGESVLMKIVGYHPANPSDNGLPTILSTFCLFDTRTGGLQALVEGSLLTCMRTGAASALATRLLARPGASTLGLIGCGAQAVTQLHALTRVCEVEDVLIHDTDAQAVASFNTRAARFLPGHISVQAAGPDEVSSRSDVLCTATSVGVGAGPVFHNTRCKPWLHLNAVGSDFPGKVEVPCDLLHRSLVVPDCLDQAMLEGECQQLHRDQVGPTLVELVNKPSMALEHQVSHTVFDSTGWALEDYVATQLVLSHAADMGVGSEMEIAPSGIDPRDPYDFRPPAELGAVIGAMKQTR